LDRCCVLPEMSLPSGTRSTSPRRCPVGATYTAKKGKRGTKYLITVHRNRERAYLMVKTKADAEAVCREVQRLELTGTNVVEAMRRARQAKPEQPALPTLRDGLTIWLAEHEGAPGSRPHTPHNT